MTKYRVYVTTTASGTVDIEVPDDVTDPELIAELAFNEGTFPTLSAKGSGWGESWSLELGDWETEVEDGVAYVTDENGDRVTEKEGSDA